jgi:hypothetical protein
MKKTIKNTIIAIALMTCNAASAQNINWKSFSENQKQLFNVNAGYDYSFGYGFSYGLKLKTKLPLLISIDYSAPFGENLFDDFKTKLGGQMEAFRKNNFSVSIKAYGIFRRHETSLVRLINFGSEFSAVAGYYKEKWYVAGEFGFDKAIITQIKNSPILKEYYPGIQDGWYIPTGGNFFYGLQAGYSFGKSDVSIKIGKTITQDFKTTAAMPVYLQLGLSRRF